MASISEDRVKALLQRNKGEDFEDLSLDEIDSFGNDESIKEMYTDLVNYRKMLNERITFINDELTAAIPFTRENLYLMCAYSGSGKSTAAANISYPLWKQEKKILVISNEESKQDVIFRIACLHLGYNFNDFKKNSMPKTNIKECMDLFPEITKYVKVADVNYRNGLTSTVEGVKRLLENLKDADYSCVMIDYYQLIKKSTTNPNAKSYDTLNDLRIWIGQYIKRANLPVVVFAQLHSLGKRNNKDLDNRIKHCPDIYEPSTVVIEMTPDFALKTTDFIIHKDRFGMAGHRITCSFDRGRFAIYDEEAVKRMQQDTVEDIEGRLGIQDDGDEN
jgi:replicative DNA helicase